MTQHNSIDYIGWHRHIDYYLELSGSDLRAKDLEKYLLLEPRPNIAKLARKFGVKDWRTMDKWVKKYDKVNAGEQ
jgi:hypothetical protein